MTVLFSPLLPPLRVENGKKRRANAKPPVTTRIEYFHEDVPLRNFLVKALDSVKRNDLFECSWIFQGHELDTDDCLTLSYTIPRRVTDQIVISNERDYKQMMDEITSKSPFEVKVYIVENKVYNFDCHQSFLSNNTMETGGGEDDSEEEPEHEEATGSRKKQKVCYSFYAYNYLYITPHCAITQ